MDNQQSSNLNLPPGQAPDNYLVWAILCTIFCCLPLGIVSIVKSSQVNSKWQLGDYDGARAASADAKKFATWGAIAGIVVLVLYILFFGGMALVSGGFR